MEKSDNTNNQNPQEEHNSISNNNKDKAINTNVQYEQYDDLLT